MEIVTVGTFLVAETGMAMAARIKTIFPFLVCVYAGHFCA